MSYCDWDTTDELCLRYHDEEWGVPLHDDRGQFEFLTTAGSSSSSRSRSCSVGSTGP